VFAIKPKSTAVIKPFIIYIIHVAYIGYML